MNKLNLSADEVLTTTRAVRKRLDLERPVDMQVIKDCLQIALQAPTGSNSQGWHFVVVTDESKKQKIADYYQQSFTAYRDSPSKPTSMHEDDPTMQKTQERVLDSAQYLADNLAKVPAFLIPCTEGLTELTELPQIATASIYGSIIPSVWSFMLAARERGLGTCWTTLHLAHEKEIASLLEIPETFSQIALIPIAYTQGVEFKPAGRKSLDDVLHTDSW